MRASIWVDEIYDTAAGRFEVAFLVSTEGCANSACAGFDATLVIQVDDDNFANQRYSFAGWNVGESSNGEFRIVRNGALAGISLNGIEDIEEPEIVCHD